MLDTALQRLHDTWGYSEFRGQQGAAITAALEGRDALVLMPTGGGKSLCYQIPGLVREGMGLVISPLIALMQDQVSALQQLGIRAAYLNSSLSPQQQQALMQDVQQGQIELLYIAPERLLSERSLNWLSRIKLSLIAIDEAHCVSQWGHDFRQDYLLLYQLADWFPGVPRMALTATADMRTRDDICHRLALHEPERLTSSFDRPNIRYSVAAKTNARSQLLQFLNGRKGQAGIVYCLSRKKVESTAEWLQSKGFQALPYHAGLPQELRQHHQQRFLAEDSVIMVATIAFGMGIDKPDVRFVAHLDLPKAVESYYQETGRAGRDGEPAEAWMVYGLQDVVRLSQMLDNSDMAEDIKREERQKLNALLGWCEMTECRRTALLAYFGERYEGPCQNCDVCLDPPATWDGTEAAQKLLSCIYRSGQRFGAGHVIDILMGKDTDKIQQHGHQHLSTWGIGKDLSQSRWQSVLRQCLVQGLVLADSSRFGALTLTENARPLLKGERRLQLREDIAEPALRKRVSKSSSAVSDADRSLWEALRECRKQLAEDNGVPPYVIFHDATLMAMMEERPQTLSQMSHISGVGAAKLDRFGSAFLEVLQGA